MDSIRRIQSYRKIGTNIVMIVRVADKLLNKHESKLKSS